MLRAHRQAWAWQDEWCELTMEDIREIERETQEALKKKMAVPERETEEDDEGNGGRRGSSSGSSNGGDDDGVMEKSVLPSGTHVSRPHLNRTSHSAQSSTERMGNLEGAGSMSSEIQVQICEASEKSRPSPKDTPTLSSRCKGSNVSETKGSHWSLSSSKLTLNSPGSGSGNSFDLLATLRMESIMRRDSDSGSEEEFFDCLGKITPARCRKKCKLSR